MSIEPMKKLGAWLGVAAIALQIAWPLVAAAKPSSVALVPLCTVDGVTHYVEVPTEAPFEQPSSHHCPMCFLGHVTGMPFSATVALPVDRSAEPFAALPILCPKRISPGSRARAPPSSQAVTANHDQKLGRIDETALLGGRPRTGAPDRSRFVRLGVLHHQH
jgi:hypothetical protein